MVLDTTLINIQYYKVRINGKVEQSDLCVVDIEKESFGSSSIKVTNFTWFIKNESEEKNKPKFYFRVMKKFAFIWKFLDTDLATGRSSYAFTSYFQQLNFVLPDGRA